MNAVAEILADAKAAGVKIAVLAPGRIEYSAKVKPPDDLIARLRAAKPMLLCVLGGLALEVPAEWRAGARRLQTMPSPGIFESRWRALAADSALFLARSLAGQAAALGWTASDLWGCHRTRPLVRLDARGAMWSVHTAEIVAVTADALVFKRSTGARLCARGPQPAPTVPVTLAWQLGSEPEGAPPDAA